MRSNWESIRYLLEGRQPFMTLAAAAVGLGLAWSFSAGAAPVINGGPDVSGVTETAATVRWATTEESTTEVHYGETKEMGGVLRKIIPMEETEVLELLHSMWIPELKPGTTYYYRVISRTDGTAVESGLLSFTTLAAQVRNCTTADWSCDEWSACSIEGERRRTCRLGAECESVGSEKPSLVEKCTPECQSDVWECSEWGACSAEGVRTRGCKMVEDCLADKAPPPPLKDGCEPPVAPKPQLEPVAEEPEELLVPPKEPPPIIEPNPEPNETVREPLPPKPALSPEPERVIEDPEPSGERTDGESLPPTDGGGEELPPPPPKPRSRPIPSGSRLMMLPVSNPEQTVGEVVAGLDKVMAEKKSTAVSGGVVPQPKPQDVCLMNGVSAERCLDWIKVKYGDHRCFSAGITSRQSCEAYLAAENGGVFPGCVGKSEEECRAVKDMILADYLPSEDASHAEAMVGMAMTSGKADDLVEEGMTAVRPGRGEGFGLRESARSEGQETAKAILIIDADGDGIPDDLQEKMLHDEKMGESPTARALLGGHPIEQPRGSGEETDDFGVDLISPSGAGDSSDLGQLNGTCDPGAVCLVYIYSYMPLVLTVTADDNGNFTYDLGDQVADGSHTVYVAVTDETGKITKKSRPFGLLVTEAQAVSAEDLVTVDPIAAAQIERQSPPDERRYVFGVAALILATAAVTVLWLRRRVVSRPAS